MVEARGHDKQPYRSLCRDKRVVDALRERFAAGQDIPGFGSLESKGVSPRKVEEYLDRGPYEGAAINALEAIILLTGRPALLIQDGEFLPPDLEEIRARLEPRRELLRSVVTSVARLDALSMGTRYHLGTAWMLDEDIMITNRHVANNFAREQAGELVFRRSPGGIPFQADVDFRREYQRDAELVVKIEAVLYIEPDEHDSPDMAIVRVERDERLPKPLVIAADAAEEDEDVVTIGYPGDAPRTNDPTALDEYFDGHYGVKRLAPGRISGTQCGPYVFNHDCTTLGGNSGSCVVRLETGEVLGLHFAGVPEENNWAVSSTMLRERLSKIRGRFISTTRVSTDVKPAVGRTAGTPARTQRPAARKRNPLEEKVARAASAYNRPDAESAVDELIFAVDEADFAPTAADASRVLKALKSARYFDLMEQTAEAYRRTDSLADELTSLLVQALIEQKKLAEAIHLAGQARRRLDGLTGSIDERAELVGLLGRAHKQKYLDYWNTDRCRPKHLVQAFEYYNSLDYKQWWWHGVNGIACVARAARDDVSIPGIDRPGEFIRNRAIEIRKAIESVSYVDIDIWDLATAAECSLAVYLQTGRDEDLAAAMKWLGGYVKHADGNAFEYASTRRQWKEMWQLKIDEVPGCDMLPVLEGELLKHEGAFTESTSEDLEARRRAFDSAVTMDVDTKDLQARFGREGATRYKQWKKAESCAYWVCKIHPYDDPLNVKGTGFLIRGKLLSKSLEDKFYVLTNDHVVSDDPSPYRQNVCDGESVYPLSADQAFVSCELADVHNLAVKRVVGNSFYGELDFALLELERDFEPPLENVPELRISKKLPPVCRSREDAQRLFVIGYPGGTELAFSMSDNFIIDHEGPPTGKPRPKERVRLHYRSPTRKGSSGSPVFDREWKLVALHHAGGLLKRLNQKRGEDFANEGIWIESIRACLK